MIDRPEYLRFLNDWKDKQIIKVITGIRRCGKSTLFELFREQLGKQGVSDDQIISVNFEEAENEELHDWHKMYSYITSRMLPDKTNYIFLDEIQCVADYQRAVDSLLVKKNTDVYITGSNAYFMSGELATLLSGRYVELKMLPLSFKEYASAFEGISKEELYRNYVYNSSFPYTTELHNRRNIRTYLDGLYNTIVLNDIVTRKKIHDPLMLKSVIKYLFDNIGSPCSSKKIADSMTSAGRKISNHTVENYLEGLAAKFIADGDNGKAYYAADVGLRYYLLGTNNADNGHILENVVYLELIRRGFEVYIGKNGNTEVDFVAVDYDGNTEYYQVSWTVRDEKTLERELTPLQRINDHNTKILLTMDNDPPVSYNGIRQKYVLDWLLDK